MTSDELPAFLELPRRTWRGLLAIRLMALAMRLDVGLIYVLSQRASWASGWRPTSNGREGRAAQGGFDYRPTNR